MKALLLRVKNILIRPRDEWQAIKDEPETYAGVIRYAAVLATLPPAAAVAGRIVLDRNIQENKIAFSFSFVLLSNLLWYGMYVLNIAVVGAIIAAIVTSAAIQVNGIQGMRIAAYSFTPLFIAGFAAVIPGMGWIVNAAIAYGVYLLYLGIVALTSAGKKRAAWCTAASFLSAAVIVGGMNMLEYFLESLIANGINS